MGWLPYYATPSSSSSGGSSGLFVIPPSAITATTITPTFITPSPTSEAGSLIGVLPEFVLTGGVLSGYFPYALAYWAVGADTNVHFYGLDLTNASVSAPTPTQISSFSATSATAICDYGVAQTNLLNPSTSFAVIHLTSTTCGSGTDTYVVVHYMDSPTTAPTSITLPGAGTSLTSNLTPLYSTSGALTGLIYVSNAGTMYKFADITFTSPTTLVSGITAWNSIDTGQGVKNTGAFNGTTLFYSVTTTSGTNVMRVPYTGSSGNVYAALGTIDPVGTADATNVYFLDVTSTNTNIVLEPIAGGATTTLSTFTTATRGSATLDGSDGVYVVLHQTNITGTGTSSTLEQVNATAGTGQLPILYANSVSAPNPVNGTVNVQVLAPTLGDFGGALVYISTTNLTAGPTYAYSTQVRTASGNLVTGGAIQTGAVFLGRGTFFSKSILELSGITDTATPTYGGGTLYNVDMTTLAPSALVPQPTGGLSTYVVPAGDLIGSFGISNAFAEGYLVQPSGPTFPAGLILDPAGLQIRQFSLPNTSITPLE